MATQNYLILVVGPTAVGKTELCLNLAKKFNSEIISCDSRQFYKETNLGTAKPSESELEQVPHHFINSLSVETSYDVKMFERDAINLIEKLFLKHNFLILTGGSGLFADAVINGLDEMPEIDPKFRKEIIAEFEEKGLEFLQKEVEKNDPEYFLQVDINNPQRLMRAIEVFRATSKPFSTFRVKKKAERNFKTIKIGLDRDREDLYNRIDTRMDLMIEAGLFEEAASLFTKRHLNALQTVGYSEIFGFLEGKYDKEEAIRLLKRNSRRYAKRQLTWFRRDTEIAWFHPSEESNIISYINTQIVE
ncbi:tRNA (adenosine(37)-N6)-dimethylallyltransferase MiaA [Algoriphagus lutimaris]|uniref:tRNA (adenosine(37)-N6)-dimethylallyltransferase MiaA n=1 Tax=Algoriphagus lutimaris TaxID=613197 RepID=UPI00196ADEEF|nr:tRNA (adenosine(37)-N6)-dimethylallyltransferase MiaA [Algoriphagus lutimaris]MBN3519787.1 tRNA (adenosine(37)-N6)-dimethylallyltransferase MiaA [Algoriphagus lutimaris]